MRYLTTVFLGIAICCIASTNAAGQGRGFRGGRGPDKDFVVDRDDFHFLLANHESVRRQVKVLTNGVETITESDDKDVTARIQKHVAAMYERVEQMRPIRMRDPLFTEIFRHTNKISMKLENTPLGVRVTETSDDPYVAQLIKSHATVVSSFAEHSFQEAHKMHPVPGRTETASDSMPARQEIADMVFVEFDRIYIPALALSNQLKEEAATVALQRLSKAWDTRFVQHLHQEFADDAEWPRDLSRVAQSIALAGAELKSGALLKAHEELEPIRDILMDARRRNAVNYPLDSLSQFHATMEAIVKPAMKLDIASLDGSKIEELSKLAKQAEQDWQRVEQTDFDLAIFGKNDQQQAKFPAMLRAEREAIGRLSTALTKSDKQAILDAAKGLKPPFAKVYMFFGDFSQQTPAAR